MNQTSPDIGELSDVEKATLERTRGGSIPWKITGRDPDGNLCFGAVIAAGTRHPGMVRHCTLKVTSAGLVSHKSDPQPAPKPS